LSGTLNGRTSETFDFTVRVEDELGRADSKALSIQGVECGTGFPYGDQVYDIVEGESIDDFTFELENDCPAPYEWRVSIDGNNFGDRLQVQPTEGTMAPLGTAVVLQELNVETLPPGAYDAYVQFFLGVEVEAIQIFVSISPRPPTITTETLREGYLGFIYDQSLEVVGGSGALTWSISGGSLPVGLELEVDGAIAGTPSAPPNVSNFEVQVEDELGRKDTKELSIVVEYCSRSLDTNLEFVTTEGTNPPNQVIPLIRNLWTSDSGEPCGPYRWTGEIDEDPLGIFSFTPTSGLVEYGEFQEIEFSANAAGLAPGTYYGSAYFLQGIEGDGFTLTLVVEPAP
jgi:hypothetical protein